jgi:hypothetical protein
MNEIDGDGDLTGDCGCVATESERSIGDISYKESDNERDIYEKEKKNRRNFAR